MRFTCPSCDSSYRLSRERLGASGQAKIRCPSCKTMVRVRVTDDGKLAATIHGSTGQQSAAQVSAPTTKPAPSATRATQPHKQAKETGPEDTKVWHIAVGQESKGPLSIATVKNLLAKGEITDSSLAWRAGQDGWKKIAEISALAALAKTAGSAGSADEIKTTLKTGAASVPDVDDEATVMQDVVSAEMLARTGVQNDGGDDATVMQDIVTPAQLGRTPASEATTTNEEEDRIAAAEARTLKPGRRRPSQRPKAGLPKRAAAKPANAERKAGDTKAAAPEAAKQPANAEKAASSNASAAPGMSFFETGEQLNQDFALQMPDPNKHKPTKEEYQNLLQEFSVMFRLDQRSKRQKWLITGVLVSLLVGVVTFGVMLYLQGEQRKTLLRDSKTILAVFALPYQQSADFDLTPEEEVEAGSAIKKKKKKVSILASKLLTKNQNRMLVERKKRRKRTKSGAVAGGYIATRKMSKEELAMAEARRQAALKAALGGGYGGKRERIISAGVGAAKNVTKSRLASTFRAKIPRLKSCAESLIGGAAFTAKLHVNDMGMIDKVSCKVSGKSNAKLSSCATDVFKRVNFGRQKTATTFSGSVAGS